MGEIHTREVPGSIPGAPIREVPLETAGFLLSGYFRFVLYAGLWKHFWKHFAVISPAGVTSRERIIVALLENYHELVDPKQSGNGGERIGIMMPERARYRGHPFGRLRPWSPGTSTSSGSPPGTRPCSGAASGRRCRSARRCSATGTGASCRRSGVELPVRRDPRARRELAELGVEWLASQWGLVTEPMLPDDFEHLVA